jgi:acetyl/propionyl-CoA carboxylase alpha subunit/acetyl-CoA carboxylase carboxyltransferase component
MRPDLDMAMSRPASENGPPFRRVLIANRGEIAVRIARALSDLGIESVAVHAEDDSASLHIVKADKAVPLPGGGVAAYLDGEAIIAAAQSVGADAVHPGYGFLSENAGFARACAAAGITFIGPDPDTLDRLGDKAAARRLAAESGVPLAEGTLGAVSRDEAAAFMARLLGRPAMVKALAGGGGRGMRVVERVEELPEAFRSAAAEARAAFGSGDLYVEEFIPRARHIEVQVAGDRTGAVVHLYERECSLQRRHQKLIEIAPAPGLAPDLRQRICAAAVTLAKAAGVVTLTTVEFLVDEAGGRFVFMEANPRLQVEHTVTEEVTGIDLVQTQIALAAGQSLSALGLSQGGISLSGMAAQARVNMERTTADGQVLPTGGILTAFDPPTGPRLRVDTFGYQGYQASASFDSLLAKVIAVAPSGRWPDTRRKLDRALSEFRIEGVVTNRDGLRLILADEDVAAGRFDTTLVERKHLLSASPGGLRNRFAASAARETGIATDAAGPAGTNAVLSPTGGRLVSLHVAIGDAVVAGQVVAVVEAMKMEHSVTAAFAGHVRECAARGGDAVIADQPLVWIEPADIEAGGAVTEAEDDGMAAAIATVRSHHQALLDAERPEAAQKQHARGALTVRERIAGLCDTGSFQEFGGLIRNEKVENAAPADGVVTGTARIDGRPVMVMAQDFTVFGGSSGHLGGDKMERAAAIARRQGLPVVMLLDGGGHRIQDGQSSRAYASAVRIFHDFAEMSGWVPMVSAVLGAGFAANTNYSAMADLVVMVRGQSTMGLAGPALVKAGTGEVTTADALGGTSVQVDRQGLADLGVANEQDAFAAIRRFLSYLPSNAGIAPPLASDWAEPVVQKPLESIVPANTRRAYDMRDVVSAIADADSIFELKPTFAANVLTSFARIGGRPVGIIANQPLVQGGMLDAWACEKAAHFIALCDAYGLPLIYLADIPGLSIGSGAEATTLGRRSAKMLFELGHASVPRISIILRKGYGLGYLAMAGGRSFDADGCFAWPTAEICAMSVEGSVDVAYRSTYERAENPAAKRQELIQAIRAQISPIKAAEGFGIDDVIEPGETRARILEILERSPLRRHRALPPKVRAIPPI